MKMIREDSTWRDPGPGHVIVTHVQGQSGGVRVGGIEAGDCWSSAQWAVGPGPGACLGTYRVYGSGIRATVGQ